MIPQYFANWKMHHGPITTRQFFEQRSFKTQPIVFFLPTISLSEAQKFLDPHQVAAQNFFASENNSITGETSLTMLKEAHVNHVLIGHSERRKYFHESQKILNQKVLEATEAGFTVTYCFGEDLGQDLEACLTDQLLTIAQLPKDLQQRCNLAYEPLWAIGSGVACSPEQIEIVMKLILKKVAAPGRLIYGGSVTADNVKAIFTTQTQGVLIGKASLNPDTLHQILMAHN
jgi:triosephosphate isomerase